MYSILMEEITITTPDDDNIYILAPPDSSDDEGSGEFYCSYCDDFYHEEQISIVGQEILCENCFPFIERLVSKKRKSMG
jgi:hypothetical protein